MHKIDCFKIRVCVQKDSFCLESSSADVIYETVLKTALSSNPLIMEADPFLFVYNGILFLFYEELRYGHRGVLRMRSTKDMKHWTLPITVLDEPFHLSFPNVFEHDGCVYMLPETGNAHEVRLYKACDKTLTKFVFHKTILKRTNRTEDYVFDYADSTIVCNGGGYYLFTTVDRGEGNTLELYYSEKLDGLYAAHPQSPLFISQKYGRNAGSISEINGELYRFAQDCCDGYGEDVHLFKINVLTPNDYSESLVKSNLLDRKDSFYKDGGHQVCVVNFKGQTIVATDAKEKKYVLLPRLYNHIKQVLQNVL